MVGAFNNNSVDVAGSMVVATKRRTLPMILPPSRKSKKPRQGEEEESEEADSVDNTTANRRRYDPGDKILGWGWWREY